MKNLKIGKKFIVTFGIILVFFVATGITAIVGMSNIADKFQYFYEKPFKISNEVIEMRREIQAAVKYVMYSTTTSDQAQTEAYINSAQEELSGIKTGIELLYANSSIDKSVIDDFKANMDASIPAKKKVFNYAIKQQNDAAISTFFDEYYPALIKANAYLEQINDYTQEKANQAYYDSESLMNICLAVLIAVIIGTFIITIVFAVYITKSLKRPIEEIENAANEMSDGRFDVTLTYHSKDELGQLSDSMRTMVQRTKAILADTARGLKEVANSNFDIAPTVEFVGIYKELENSIADITVGLSNTMSQIGQASDQVASGSDQVSSGAQALSQGATEQASSIEELSATITEISEQIKKNAENATRAKNESEKSGQEITESNRQMQEMIAAMNDISDKSNEIGKIIKTIDDIAFQTNILALNAAVEAARAGAAGKGFAVVADEVRNLAGKSAEAAKNTAALIQEAILAIENGTKMADNTAQAILSVVDGAKTVTTLVDEIATASGEQATAVNQVTQGVEQISSVVQTNSATAEESAAASEELSGQAQMLKTLVGRFKLKEGISKSIDGESYTPLLTAKTSEHKAELLYAEKY